VGNLRYRSALICFIGTDGTGKSTLTKLTTKDLAMKGLRVKRTYGRHQYFLSRAAIILGRRIFLKNRDPFTNYDQYLFEKRGTYKKFSRLIDFYISLLMTEYLIQIFFKVMIPLKLGYNVVSDRYLYDTIINDVAIDRNMALDDVKKIYKKYEKRVPCPDVVFLIQIPEDVAMERKNDIPSPSFIRIRNELYRQFIDREEIIPIDGTLPLIQLQAKVLSILKQRLDIT
jgi:thymidylate kinase